ncbi:ABC transporter ATP-binding protein [Paenibacillus thiaminolyticus]|uniref:ABC transporter ATP-binding protein n=1 Tax=Paenibacillus thiaminolyticus TaxID=49283 RepID=UPI0011643D60|nr:ABC transporter ATP-binding protein [Paenibacillus thiaminolyticus]NGP60928.1 ABC transporter ATP-binding protein [Paenibacillus thiaminolyticus]
MNTIILYMKRLHQTAGLQLSINIIGMVISSLLEGMTFLLLIPMLTVGGVLLSEPAWENRLRFLNILHSLPQASSLAIILTVYLLIVVTQNLIHRAVTVRNAEIEQHFSRQLRYENYSALLRAQWSFFINRRTSDLVNALTIETARVLGGISLLLQFITSALFTLLQIIFAFWISPKITLFVIACGAMLAFLSRGFIRKSKQLGSQTSKLAQAYLAGITDQLQGMKDIKSNNLEPSRLEWHQQLTEGTMQEQLDYVRLRLNSQLLYKIASSLLVAGFIFTSFRFFPSEGPSLLIVILLFARLWPRFTSLQSKLEQLASTIPAFKALQQLQRDCKLAADQAITLTESPAPGPGHWFVMQGIEVRNLSFRYQPQLPVYALQNISVHIPAQGMTAIVGKSGAGKSTFIDILMGLMQPESGQILVDGIAITNDNLLAYRRSIGYVAQDPFLYNATIRENLLMVKPSATENELWEALDFSSAAEFVRKLPRQLETLIGDRGIRLSGGERQRLVLARAIIRQPSILVLDEATSALDTENEQKILTALHRLKDRITVVVVAHRLSTIQNAEQILVIHDGKLVEQGTFLSLSSEKKSIFANLLQNQEAQPVNVYTL